MPAARPHQLTRESAKMCCIIINLSLRTQSHHPQNVRDKQHAFWFVELQKLNISREKTLFSDLCSPSHLHLLNPHNAEKLHHTNKQRRINNKNSFNHPCLARSLGWLAAAVVQGETDRPLSEARQGLGHARMTCQKLEHHPQLLPPKQMHMPELGRRGVQQSNQKWILESNRKLPFKMTHL